MGKWFQTWNRPEYKEWALEISKGYLLVILRREKDKYLCAKAKLIMGEEGLPGFEILEQLRYATKNRALERINSWKNSEQLLSLKACG